MVAESVELELLKTAEESEKHGILSSTPNASKTSSNPPLIAILPEITLPDFLRKYNVSTFKKDTFREVRLVGRGEYAKYSTRLYRSMYPLVWSFVEDRLKEQGEAYIRFVNGRNAWYKNPPFITREEHQRRKADGNNIPYRPLNVSGLEGWAVYINYGQYAWINVVLRKRMLELGLSLEDFSLEYIPGLGMEWCGSSSEDRGTAAPAESGTASKVSNGITGMDSSGRPPETAAEASRSPSPRTQVVTETAYQEIEITGPVPLSGYVSSGGGKKASLMKLSEMVAAGRVCAGDGVYVKGQPDQRGTITADGTITYGGQLLSLNKYVKAVLGEGSYNAYLYVYHEKTGELLDNLR